MTFKSPHELTRGAAHDLAAIVAYTREAVVLCAAVLPPYIRHAVTITVIPLAVAYAPITGALAYIVARAFTSAPATPHRLGSSFI